jgi:hypothetical protein
MAGLQAALNETEAGLDLRERVDAFTAEHARSWLMTPTPTPAEFSALGPPAGFRRHFVNARAAAALIDELVAQVERIPDDAQERRIWRESVRERLQDFGAARLGWPAGYRRLLFGDAFFAASVTFARSARAFDPELRMADLWQALRNVWIGNSLQMVLGLPLRLGQGLFAYSMLYPVTDNLLDDPSLPASAKRAFNHRLGHRLAGLPVLPASDREAAAFRLVGQIEHELPRRDFAEVYESLLAIHRGQVRSLRQQSSPTLTDAQILDISCEKGGSSVLADLYLVSGRPDLEQQRFAFGYGVFLQLLDDLQDVEADLAVGHQTLFTRAAERGPLDELTARLLGFIERVLESPLLARPELGDGRDLIRRNCVSLLMGAVAAQPRRFSSRFRRRLERQWPLTCRAMRRLRRRAERRGRRVMETRQGHEGESLLDMLLAEA